MIQTICLFCVFILCSTSACENYTSTSSQTNTPKMPILAKILPNVGPSPSGAKNGILEDVSWALRLAVMKDSKSNPTSNVAPQYVVQEEDGRRVGIEGLVVRARRQESKTDIENDDQNMKLKLFRLMYESVRDSDLKVKRAELIKKSYANSSVFEIGYLLGDITDKYNIMTDIGLTLKRLYHEWKPIEHINAYEQIANLAIDVGHIVDMIKGVEKKLTAIPEAERKEKAAATPSATTPAYFQINK